MFNLPSKKRQGTQEDRPRELVLLAESASRANAERFSPANSWVSGGSTLSTLPGPLNFSSGEVTISTNYPHPRLRNYTLDEGIALAHSFFELVSRIDRWVHDAS